jgi:two-component system, cell cycle response regulator
MLEPSTPRLTLLSRVSGWWFALLACVCALYCGHIVLGLGGRASDAMFQNGAYNFVMLGAALAVIVHAAGTSRDRIALLLVGLGLLGWALGDLYYTIQFEGLTEVPFPSIDDAFYLSFYPLAFIGLGILIRSRLRGVSASVWLDGLIAGLGLSAVAAGVLLDPILAATGGSFAAVATNLAYPVGDLLLFLVAVTAISLTGWRPDWTWGLIALGMIVLAGADTVYLFQVASSTFKEETLLEPLWPLAFLALVLAMRMPARVQRRSVGDGWRNIVVPCVGSLAAVGVLFVDHGGVRVNAPARYLALATLVAATLRIVLAFRRSLRLQQQSRLQSVTDHLTGLGNRRMLEQDLDDALEAAAAGDSRVLVLYDLNGFKLYNDSFGHPAGDDLLARLGRNLGAAAAPSGKAYRMGGDEFCALLDPRDRPVDELLARTRAALSEAGEGFEITASCGLALLPSETHTATEALQLADRRMYADKEGRPQGVKRQLQGVLLQILGERQPALRDHTDGVAALAHAIGQRMELEPEELDVLVRAAEMHDIGKVALPETILDKPGPLDEDEWAFMRRHTILGERILCAAPALAPVAKLVRSSHERWDGAGYPDRLAGEEIPLGSRIIFACDAFDAIVSARAYSSARGTADALAELERCAGSQFDPKVVKTLTELVADERVDRDGGELRSPQVLARRWSRVPARPREARMPRA